MIQDCSVDVDGRTVECLVKKDLFLYKIDKALLLRKGAGPKKVIYIEHSGDNLVNFHPDSCWTKGDSSVENIVYRPKPNERFLVLHTAGWTPLKGGKLNLKLYANGKELEFDHENDKSFYFKLPRIGELNRIRIISSTFVPQEFGLNDDLRRLGVYVQSLSIE